jgi:hypothetical protein
VLFGCGAVLLGRWLAKRAIGGTWSPSYAAIAVLLATPITYYATYMPSYSHAADAFACGAFLAYWAVTIGRADWKRWIVLGLLLGLATLIRTQELALGVVVAIEVVTELVRAARQRSLAAAKPWLLGGIATLGVSLVVMIPQFAEWHIVFGKVTELPQGARYTRFDAPMVMELLFSRRNGWFTSTPVAYAGVIGLFCLPRRSRLIAIGLLAAVAIQVYLNSVILDWWGSSSFGQRRMCNVTLPLVVGLAALMWRIARLVVRIAPTPRIRVPRIAVHVLAIVLIAPCVVTNYNHLRSLKAGKGAESELDPDCCSNIPRPVRSTVRKFVDHVGNPFAFPANAIFALRHDVPLTRWDQIVGVYPMTPGIGDVRGDNLWTQRGVWRLGSPNLKPFMVDGWSAPFTNERLYRVTIAREATALVPNLMPYGQRVSLWLAPLGTSHARVKWNGRVVADVQLSAGWTKITFDLPHIELHTNEITIESDLAPAPRQPGWPALLIPVGVAVSDVELEFLRP